MGERKPAEAEGRKIYESAAPLLTYPCSKLASHSVTSLLVSYLLTTPLNLMHGRCIFRQN